MKPRNPMITMITVLILGVGMVTAGVIQTRESTENENLVAELYGLRIQNDIITVKIKIRNNGQDNTKLDFYFKDSYIIDEANQKKYYILKDSDGKCIGGPFSSDGSGGRFEFWVNANKMRIIWAKFPLPTDNPEAITISIPGFLPFDGIKLAIR